MNVREKLSLCYYCDSYFIDLKNVMMIESGVDTANIEKAQQAVAAELKAMQNGDFTDEEMENAKLYICSGFMSNYDSEWDIGAWYRVPREQIIESAKSMKPDTIFILKAEGGSDDE